MVNGQNIIQEIQNPKNWKKTHKKSYEVYMCRPLQGTKCRNELEGVDYVTDEQKQFIISGTQGEVWVVDVMSLAKTYNFGDGTPITRESLRRKCDNNGQINWTKLKTKPGAVTCWAFFLPKSIQNFPVRHYTANMSGVNHGYGDFLLCDDVYGEPNLDRIRVINGVVFPKTYDLHAFPGMFSNEITQSGTPHPKYNFIRKQQNTDKVSYSLYPGYVNNLITTFKYVKDKLQLSECGKFITEEGSSYRIDFESKIDKDAILYIQLEGLDTTVYYQNTRTGQELEQVYPATDTETFKKAFVWLSGVLKNGRNAGPRVRKTYDI